MNAAAIENSPRLQRFLGVLADGQWHSTREIIQRGDVCAVSACAAECRANKIEVECEQRGKVWFYRLPCRAQMEMAA